MELFAEKGFDSTTVVEITERAGLTERTFYRHFADKREVVFAGAAELERVLLENIESVVGTMTPFEAVTATLCAGAETFFDDRRDLVRWRQDIIDVNVDLQERELIKLASIASALADALHRSGVDVATAELSAESGVTVFRIAFDRWVREDGATTLSQSIRLLAARLAGIVDLSTRS